MANLFDKIENKITAGKIEQGVEKLKKHARRGIIQAAGKSKQGRAAQKNRRIGC